MEVKIKQGNEMLDATIEMVDGVMVVSPKEVKFEPKDGDVVFVRAYFEHIIIYRNSEESIECYLELLRGNLIPTKSSVCNRKNVLEFRPATEEEKKKLFDKLAEEGYEFDFEKKELVKLKWKPSMYDPYFTPFYESFEFIPFKINWVDTNKDDIRYNKGLCFKTEKECQEFCDRLNDAIILLNYDTDRHLKNELSELAAERNARKIKELREGSTEKPIDWQQVRIQAAIAAMKGLISNPDDFTTNQSPSGITKKSILFADALIEELKGE